jgi:hypothetical protein
MNETGAIDIFISYRRTDTKAISRLMFEDLCRRFGREHVFFDVDRIPLAPEHHRHLADQVAGCSVLLVVIGDRWAEGPHAFTDDDLVRIEVRSALEAGVPILPVLADGAKLPAASDALDLLQPLLRRPALPVDSGRHFAHHMAAVCGEIERLAGEHGSFRRRDGRSDFPTTMSHPLVAAATIPPFEKKAAGANKRWLVGLMWLGAAAAVAFGVLRATSRSAAPSTALGRAMPAASAPAESAAPATIAIRASATPAEATLYLDGQPLPSNPYVGRIGADGTQHLLRAEAPGHASNSRAFAANREVAIILALAKTSEPPRAEGKKARSNVVSPPAPPASVEPATSTPDDCKLSPYYVDERNIKVVRPECLLK